LSLNNAKKDISLVVKVNIDQDWLKYVKEEFDKSYFKELMSFVETEYDTYTCFPPKHEIFSAFEYCAPKKLKVVIIGQDPYHGYGQANGLCFSVNDDIVLPPSLRNIFKELASDLGKPFPNNGNLRHWAEQGILLLNATLTVRENEAGSHQKRGWEQFTDAIIRNISEHKNEVVFLLWGGFAKKKSKLIDADRHNIILSGHPSPLSANRGYWFGNKSFSKTNSLLEQAGLEPIDWLK